MAQWRGRRSSESLREESLGFTERRDSTAWTMEEGWLVLVGEMG